MTQNKRYYKGRKTNSAKHASTLRKKNAWSSPKKAAYIYTYPTQPLGVLIPSLLDRSLTTEKGITE